MVLLEVCCTGIESALNMLGEGANRVELCSVLECGGLTPAWLSRLREKPSIVPSAIPGPPASEAENQRIDLLSHAHVLIRCRPGDFCYS
ncbi:MAG TPA: copper homeostasis protein CutC, partial [Bacteroidales bacterium]|nr:copper homeostasis protein CutC [Bacteroidales bacterium]